MSSVSSSLARVLRVAWMRPWCQRRTVAETEPASPKPIRSRLTKVSGSSSVPVNTRLPPSSPSAGSSPKSAA